jgi:hypothetical protein
MTDEPGSELTNKIVEALRGSTVTHGYVKLYLPNKTKEGDVIQNIEERVEYAMVEMTRLNGGASCQKVRGMWRSKETGGPPLQEETALVYSFIFDPERFESHLTGCGKTPCRIRPRFDFL